MSGFSSLMRYIVKHWPALTAIVASAFASSYLSIYISVLIGNAASATFLSGGIVAVVRDAELIVLISAVAAVLQFATGYGGQWLGQKVVYFIRRDIFNSIQSKDFTFHDSNSTGDLMARSTMDVEAVRRLVAFGSPQFLSTTFLILSSAYILLTTDLRYGLIFVLSLPFLLLVTYLLAFKQEPFWNAIREKYGKMSNVLQENIVGQRLVRSFTAEERQIKEFEKTTDDYLKSYIGVSRVRSFITPLLALIVSLGISALVVIAAPGIVAGASIGPLVTSVYIYLRILGPIRFYGQLVLFFENGMAGMKRINEVMLSPVAIKDKPSAIIAGKLKGDIVFENVSFAYKNEPVLRNINLHVKPGEVVALVGESGSGKTSLANLIPRFYDASAGRVLVDGVDVRDYSLRSLRQKIGFVSQDILLFGGTIRENIAFGTDNPPLERVVWAAKTAQIADFIDSLPDRYDTLVGERGITLSGGQKQRIAIARALLIDPRILILDDSTSSVDVETELKLQEALRELVRGRTTFVISHRLSTLRLADRIVVFKDGKIADEGTLSELSQREGIFSEIFGTPTEFQAATAAGGED